MTAELTPFPGPDPEDRVHFLDEAVVDAGPDVAAALGDLHDELVQPPAPEVSSGHIAAAAATAREVFRTARRRGRLVGLAVGASRSAAVVVVALGATTGLAAAEALPRPAARMIVSVAEVVNVPLPQSINRSALTAGERQELDQVEQAAREAKAEKRNATRPPDTEFAEVSTATSTSQRTSTTQRPTTTTTEESSTQKAATDDSTTTTTTSPDDSTTTTTSPDESTTTTTSPDESTTTTEPEDDDVNGKSAGRGNGRNKEDTSSTTSTTVAESSESSTSSETSDDSTLSSDSTGYSSGDEVS